MFLFAFGGTSATESYFSRAFWEATRPKVVSKVCVLHEAVPPKKMHGTGEGSVLSSTVKKHPLRAIWNSSSDPGNPAKVVSSTAAPTPLPHAPGARMTAVINKHNYNLEFQKNKK